MAKYFIRKRFDSLVQSKAVAPVVTKPVDSSLTEELETIKPTETEISIKSSGFTIGYLAMNTQVQSAYEELKAVVPDPIVAEPVVCETLEVATPDLVVAEEKPVISEVIVPVEDTIVEPIVSISDVPEPIVSISDVVLEKNTEKQTKVKNKNKKNQTDK